MQGIIFNTIEDFNTLNADILSYVVSNGASCTSWGKEVPGTDGTYLMLGMEDTRLIDYDFTGYTVTEILPTNEIYFVQTIL